MSRYNLFGQIHKALRAMLYDTAITVQQTNFTNKEEAEFTLLKLQNMLDVFDEHSENEVNFILPAIQMYEPSLIDSFVQKHAEDHKLAEKIRKAIASYNKAIREEEKISGGSAINKLLNEFMQANMMNMDSEESALNKILWRYYSDSEIMILNQRTSRSEPEQDSFRNWVIRGLTNTEIVGLMKAVGKNAPDFVFNSLLALAEKELPGIRYNQVLEGLTNGAMVA